MKQLMTLSLLPKVVPLYILFFCYLLKNCIFIRFSFMRKKSKRWLVNFPTFIAVTLEHIHILIKPV